MSSGYEDFPGAPIFSMYGHILQLVEEEARGIREAGGEVDIFQIPETLTSDVLEKMSAPGKSSYPGLGVLELRV